MMLVRLPVAKRWTICATLCSCLPASSRVDAETKYVRLSKKIIPTKEPGKIASRLQQQAVEKPVSGLYLLQFDDQIKHGWSDQLRELGIELLRFVPDDALVVELEVVRRS